MGWAADDVVGCIAFAFAEFDDDLLRISATPAQSAGFR
jgi:hypothetical protein